MDDKFVHSDQILEQIPAALRTEAKRAIRLAHSYSALLVSVLMIIISWLATTITLLLLSSVTWSELMILEGIFFLGFYIYVKWILIPARKHIRAEFKKRRIEVTFGRAVAAINDINPRILDVIINACNRHRV